MAEAKVFPIGAFVGVLRGQAADQGMLDLMSALVGVDVDAAVAPVAQGLVKGYIYEQEPELTKYAEGDLAKLGSQVKIIPMEGEEAAVAKATLEAVATMKTEGDAAKAEVAKLTEELDAAKKESADVAAKLKVFETASAGAEKAVITSNTKIDEHIKKLNDLLAEVERVKKEGVVVAGVAAAAGAAAAPAGDAAASGSSGDAPATGGEPEADFGFGSNPFADSDW